MCGIAGFFRAEALTDIGVVPTQRLLAAMADRMLHRGPDDGGVWVEPGAHCGLSHRRLSIIDLSAAGHQPMTSWDGRYVIAFNGEVYNFLELRPELEVAGARFATRTDTEVLIEAVRAWGLEKALERFDGMFAFALYDRQEHELMLARDPFGEKPLYTMMRGGEIAFASELTALRELSWFDDACDEDALAEYLCFQYIGAPRTLYRSVRKLPPGHFARIRPDSRLEVARYFAFRPYGVEGEIQWDDQVVDELEDILCRSLRRRLISDVPLGAFLSGGVDSSTVAALATRKLGVPLKTYSIGFEGAPESEHLAARRFAQLLGTEHHEQMVNPDASRFLHEAGRHFDEPNGDTSCLPTYLLSAFAREQVTVAVSGDGGDELFGGYGRYFDTLEEDRRWRRGELPGWNAGDAYYSLRILLCQEAHLRALFGVIPPGLRDHLDDLRDAVALGSPVPLLHRLRRTDAEHYMPGAVLPKVDRMSMRHSLEVRTPFLNVELARFAEKLPPSLLYQPGQGGKLILKRLARRYLPAELVDAPKRGFGLPVSDHWNRTVAGTVSEMIRSPGSRLARLVDPARLRDFTQSLTNFDPPASYLLWAMGILEGYLQDHSTRGEAEADARRQIERRVIRRLDPFVASRDRQVAMRFREEGTSVVALCPEEIPATLADLEADGTGGASSPTLRLAERPEQVEPLLADTATPGSVVWTGDYNPSAAELARWGELGCRLSVFGDAGARFANRVRGYRPQGWRMARYEGKLGPLRVVARSSLAPGNPDGRFPWLINGILRRLSPRIAWRVRRLLRLPRLDACGGQCYLMDLGGQTAEPRDLSAEYVLLEDGLPLCLAGSSYEEITASGRGRWIAWGRQIFFSSSDGSDPRTNGRLYEVAGRDRALAKAMDRFLEPLPTIEGFVERLRQAIAEDNELDPTVPPDLSAGVVFFTSSLSSGGAERQWCYLARELDRRGIACTMVTSLPMYDGADLYETLLAGTGVRVIWAAETPVRVRPTVLPGETLPRRNRLAAALPGAVRDETLRLLHWLEELRPAALCCQLDPTNIYGGLAGLLAGTPCILLSFRNMRPSHMPHFNQPWYEPLYQALAASRRIVLSGNSREGNADYADWLGLAADDIALLPNILDFSDTGRPPTHLLETLRSEVKIPPGAPVVTGVFRLSQEKRPRLFLEVARRLLDRRPDLHVVHVGVGAMAEEFLQAAEAIPHRQRLHLLGSRRDVHAVLAMSSLVLLVSAIEGMPNVIMESQALGIPAVCTDAGGVRSCLEDGQSGLVATSDDPDTIAAACFTLLDDPDRLSAMAQRAAERARTVFDGSRVVAQLLELLSGRHS